MVGHREEELHTSNCTIGSLVCWYTTSTTAPGESLPVAKLGPVSLSTQDQGLQMPRHRTHLDVNCRYLPGLISVQIRCEGGYNATHKLCVLSTDSKQDYSGNFPSKWRVNVQVPVAC